MRVERRVIHDVMTPNYFCVVVGIDHGLGAMEIAVLYIDIIFAIRISHSHSRR